MSIILKLFWWVSLLLVSSLLFSYKLNSICIIALLVLWLAEGGFRLKFQQLIREPFFILSVLLFTLYLLSIIQSEDKGTARFFVEKNLSLVALPLILLSRWRFDIARIHSLCKVFIAGTCILMSIATTLAVWKYFSTSNYEVFFYHNLSDNVGISAIIASFLCIVSLAFLFYLPGTSKVKWLLVGVHSFWLVLLSSKLFLLVLVVLILVNVLSERSIKFRWVALSGLVLITVLITITSNPIRKRFNDMSRFQRSYLTTTSFNEGMYFDGLSLRLIYVRFGLEIMREEDNYMFGVGTGDAETLLKQKIKAYNMYQGDGIKNKEGYLKYSFHNEFLQKFVQLGIIGISLFISLLAYCYYMAIRCRNRLLLNLMLIFTFSFFTDTLLEQQIGIVLFLMFVCLAINEIRMKQKECTVPVQA